VWNREYVYPAPTVGVHVSNWPLQDGLKEVPVGTSVWWQADKYPLSPKQSISLTRHPERKLKDDFVRSNLLGKSAIEDVAVEEREIVTAEGKKSLKTCLVVRCRHEPNRPVCVLLEPDDKIPVGEEHCYYSQADKCTAIFWNLPDPEKANFRLHVISIPEFKAACADAGRTATFALPAPTTKPGPTSMALSGSP